MPLTLGTRLGPYEILSPLGAGGMGEVYRARDTRLEREVAIKVLPAAFSQDAERLWRFEQEARAASLLNHTNILTIYDIGTHQGSPYIVSELLEGETLRVRLQAGTLPVRKAIDYAQQITRGLAAAHEKGITHRDLKPENLFLTTDGRVKILDFGLAKLKRQSVRAGVDSEASTALLSPSTDPGKVMGTVGYVSPEQVQGQEADHRADLFAVGVILYEMLSGRRAFEGASAAAVMSAILRDEPPELMESNDKVPPQLERIVRRCLEKKPGQRFQSASDLSFALETLSTPSGSRLETSGLSAAAERAGKSWLLGNARLAWVVAAILFLASLPFVIAYFQRAPVEVRALRFNVPPPEKSTVSSMALSPDGRRLAFIAADSSGKTLLYLRPLDSLTPRPLPGTDGAGYPFWSPDSRSIGFFAEGKLKKIEATGGPAQALCNAPTGRGGTWNRDGVIVFAPNTYGGLYRVSATGGEPSPLTTSDPSRRESSHRWPQFLPDGRSFLYFTISGTLENRGIYVGSLGSKETKRLLGTDSNAVYAPPGYLLFRREGTLMAHAFDLQKLQLTGEPFLIAEHVGSEAGGTYHTFLTSSENGVLAYYSGDTEKTQLVWLDRGGKQIGVIGSPGDYINLALSPDGQRIAFDSTDPQTADRDIWLLELARGTPMRFTFDPANDWFPVWSPDGSRIVFASNRGGYYDLYQKAASGAGNDELLLKSSDGKFPTDWSLDGWFILYQSSDAKTKRDIWVLPLEGDRKPFPFLQTEFNEQEARFSPNGKWIAYTSDESGTTQVYVQSFPASGGKWRVSTGGGTQPRWRRDGQELFYRAADGKLMSVEVKTGALFEAGVPKLLFQIHSPTVAGPFQISYAVTADGQRFLVRSAMEQTTSTPTTVVANWTAELKR